MRKALLSILLGILPNLLPATAGAISFRVPEEALLTRAGWKGGGPEEREAALSLGLLKESMIGATVAALECPERDETCPNYVFAVLATRRWAVSRPGEEATIEMVAKTPSQFTGLWSSRLLSDPAEVASRAAVLLEQAGQVFSGQMDGKLPIMTHYLTKKAARYTDWAIKAKASGVNFMETPDGHIWFIGDGRGSGVMPFRPPKGATSSQRRLSWHRCTTTGDPKLIGLLFPSYITKGAFKLLTAR